MGGGHRYFVPQAEGGLRGDNRNLEKEWLSEDSKRRLLLNKDDLRSLSVNGDEQVLG